MADHNSSLASRLRINVGTITDGAIYGNIATIFADAGFTPAICQSFSIEDIVFTAFNTNPGPQPMLSSHDSVTTATYDLSTSNFNITGIALPDGTDVFFYPSFPVMDLLADELSSINYEFEIGFSNRIIR